MAADRVIRWTTTAAVIGVAAIAAVPPMSAPTLWCQRRGGGVGGPPGPAGHILVAVQPADHGQPRRQPRIRDPDGPLDLPECSSLAVRQAHGIP